MLQPVYLETLTLTAFRNHALKKCALSPAMVVLWGENGAGKTNVLEAVSLLSAGRGLRYAKMTDFPHNHTPQPWAITADVCHDDYTVRIGTGNNPDDLLATKRIVRLDGETQSSQTALEDLVPMVWLTPKMDRLFLEGSTERRKFLDRLVYSFYPEHLQSLKRYEHALKERQRLLYQGVSDPHWLNTLEQQMSTNGVAITASRLAVVEMLNSYCAQRDSSFPVARLSCVGALETGLSTKPAVAVEEEFAALLKRTRFADAETIGAHKSDLILHHVGKNTEVKHCSTGEQKAVLIAVILSCATALAARKHKIPLVLLDEIAAHLDAKRRDALFAELLALRCQAWLTGTEKSHFESLIVGGQCQDLGL